VFYSSDVQERERVKGEEEEENGEFFLDFFGRSKLKELNLST
jgi:hypothetical protein